MSDCAANEGKDVYRSLHDRIMEKRYRSASPIRRYAHERQYGIIVGQIPPGSTVLDAGCGEGVLSILLAQRGCRVTGVDLSVPNVDAARRYADEAGVTDRTSFTVGDAEQLPFQDGSFDYVVSSHVLEHLPDFIKGASEIARVARKGAIVAIPTCLNPVSWALLGGDKYWTVSRRTIYAVPFGFLRVLFAFLTGKEGVNEGYAGRTELIHIFRFPWRGRALLERGGLKVSSQLASSFISPYVPFLLPLARLLESFAGWPLLRHLGYGTTYVCEPSR